MQSRQGPIINPVARTAALLFFVGLLIADSIVAFFLLRERLSPFFQLTPAAYMPFVSNDANANQDTPVPPTPTGVPSLTPTPVPTLTQKTYVVQSGDTLWKIAQENNLTVDELVDANQLKDRNYIQVGQELKIPLFTPTPTATPKP